MSPSIGVWFLAALLVGGAVVLAFGFLAFRFVRSRESPLVRCLLYVLLMICICGAGYLTYEYVPRGFGLHAVFPAPAGATEAQVEEIVAATMRDETLAGLLEAAGARLLTPAEARRLVTLSAEKRPGDWGIRLDVHVSRASRTRAEEVRRFSRRLRDHVNHRLDSLTSPASPPK